LFGLADAGAGLVGLRQRRGLLFILEHKRRVVRLMGAEPQGIDIDRRLLGEVRGYRAKAESRQDDQDKRGQRQFGYIHKY